MARLLSSDALPGKSPLDFIWDFKKQDLVKMGFYWDFNGKITGDFAGDF